MAPAGIPPESEVRLGLASDWDVTRALVARHASMVEVDQPLVLISQVQRSGGTLLNALLDGHPELLVAPYELHIGHPTKYDWPDLDPAAGPESWLASLGQGWLPRVFVSGYNKGKGRLAPERGLPLLLPPSFLERLMFSVTRTRPPSTSREILDRYFTAFFNAWLDLQGLWDAPKQWVVGFGPRLAWAPSGDRLRADYPDGRVICVLRDPRGWFASAEPHFGRKPNADTDSILDLWCRGTSETIALKESRGDEVLVVSYERLVTEPESVLRPLCDWLGIGWSPWVLTPTFNRRPVQANSSFEGMGHGVDPAGAERWRQVLEQEVRVLVEERTMDLFTAARAIVDA